MNMKYVWADCIGMPIVRHDGWQLALPIFEVQLGEYLSARRFVLSGGAQSGES
jgi:hypothetical protein